MRFGVDDVDVQLADYHDKQYGQRNTEPGPRRLIPTIRGHRIRRRFRISTAQPQLTANRLSVRAAERHDMAKYAQQFFFFFFFFFTSFVVLLSPEFLTASLKIPVEKFDSRSIS